MTSSSINGDGAILPKERILAGRFLRFIGFISDIMLLAGLSNLIVAVVGLMVPLDSNNWLLFSSPPFVVVLYVVFVLRYGGFLGRHAVTATLVIDERTGEEASKRQLVIRTLFKTILLVEILVSLFNKQKKRTGDYVAHTIVVKRSLGRKARMFRFLSGVGIIAVTMFLSLQVYAISATNTGMFRAFSGALIGNESYVMDGRPITRVAAPRTFVIANERGYLATEAFTDNASFWIEATLNATARGWVIDQIALTQRPRSRRFEISYQRRRS